MMDPVEAAEAALLATELTRAGFPAFRERAAAADSLDVAHAPRTYPGYPTEPLERPRRRRLVSLDGTLERRRSARSLPTEQPSRSVLSRILFAHAVNGAQGRGPAPSAGLRLALEVFVTPLVDGWLATGSWHYDRAGHHLSRVATFDTPDLRTLVPSLIPLEGGSLLLVLVADLSRTAPKYGVRAARLAALEAGHVAQNLCLIGASVDRSVVPLGGTLDRELAELSGLSRPDHVVYALVL